MRTARFLATAIIAGLLACGPRDASAQSNIVAPWCGEFLPMITEAWIGNPHRRVHYAPKYCNKIMINGVLETIPPAVAVISGGVNTDLTSTCVDKVCGQALVPNMLYRAYVYMDAGTMKINFSVTGHKEDATNGNEVHASDPAQSFIGLIATDDNGLVCGGGNLCILSWFYRGHTSLGAWIGPLFGQPMAETCNSSLTAVGPFVKVLTFGISSTFREGYTIPNIHASGTLTNTEAGKYSHAAIGIERAGTPVTLAPGSPGQLLLDHHQLTTGAPVFFRTTGALPSPLVAGTTYYAHTVISDSALTLTATPGGSELALTGPQSGAHIIGHPTQQAGPRSSFFKTDVSDAGALSAVGVGGNGAEEGWIKGTLMLAAPNGGCARVPEGRIYTDPHHS